MDIQIQQAVDIAISGTSDQVLKSQALDFINQIKSSKEGYNSCLDLLDKKSTSVPESTRFFILQVIDENISKLSDQELYQLTEILTKYLNDLINSSTSRPEAPFIKNKLASIFGTLFCFVYMNIQPNFLRNLLNLIKASANNDNAIDYYLRILIAIHYEIGDKFISRSREIMDRNNTLKDVIRAKDMVDLVDSWKNILLNYQDSSSNNIHSEIMNNCLKVIGQYINWMEISLFVTNDFIRLIFQFLSKYETKSVTCDTLIEIISKKMKPGNKLELISLLNLTQYINSVDISNEELEFVEHVSKLANVIGLELLIILEDMEASDSIKFQANEQVLQLWPVILNFLSHEYDDVSQQVFPFISNYLLLLKKFKSLISVDLLSTLLNKAILKMKYDDEDDGKDDDSFLEFNEIRAKLKHFQDTIAILNPDLYVEAIPVVINESIFNNTTNDWRRMELGLYELGNFSDSLKNNLMGLPKSQINVSKPYRLSQELLIKVINSNHILNIDHELIQLAFFELIVRHYVFFTNSDNDTKSALTNRILEIFTSPLGLFNTNEKVQLRCWYLFFRFIKLTKPVIEDSIIQSLISNLAGTLLIIKPSTEESEDEDSSSSFSSQLYLYEVSGLLISLLDHSKINLKIKLIEFVFQPLFDDLQSCIQTSEKSKIVVSQAHHTITAIGTFTRGYDQGTHPAEVVQKINNAAQVVTITLENFSKHVEIREAARFAFARFLPILGNESNLHLSKLVALILGTDLTYTELSDFLGFLGQIVHSFSKNDNIYMLLNDLLTPLLQKVFRMLNDTGPNNEYESIPDIQADKTALKKSYLSYLLTLTQNNVTSLLITETNKSNFPVVLESLFSYAYNVSDPSISKLAIAELTNIVNIIGNGKLNDAKDSFGSHLSVDGIDGFLMNNLSALIFELPFKHSEFDTRDASMRLIGKDLAGLLKNYYNTKGDNLIACLKSYFESMGLPENVGHQFLQKLIDLDGKEFKMFFIEFIESIRGK